MSTTRTLADITARITQRHFFNATAHNLNGDSIAVMTYGHGFSRQTLTGALAEDVTRSARDLNECYMGKQAAISHYATSNGTDDGDTVEQGAQPNTRARYGDEVLYYVTTFTDGARHVLGYVSADGFASLHRDALEAMPAKRRAAIRDGLLACAERVRDRSGNGSDGGEVVIRRATGERLDRSPIVTHER